MQLYTADGAAAGPEVAVSDGEVVIPVDFALSMQVRAAEQPDGGFLAVWNSPSSSSYGQGSPRNWTNWLVKKYDATGRQVGDVTSLFPPNTYTNASWNVKALKGGGAVVVVAAPSSSYAFTAVVLDASGRKVAEIPGIGSGLPGQNVDISSFDVVATRNGGFIVSWITRAYPLDQPVMESVWAQRFGPDGTALEQPRALETLNGRDVDLRYTAVTETITGNIVVVVSIVDSTAQTATLQVSQYGADWTHQVTSSTPPVPGYSIGKLVPLADGGFLILSSALDQSANNYRGQLQARRYLPSGLSAGDVITVGTQANVFDYLGALPLPDGGVQIISTKPASDAEDMVLQSLRP